VAREAAPEEAGAVVREEALEETSEASRSGSLEGAAQETRESALVSAEGRTDDATRPPEEAAELRRKLGLDEEEFSYSPPPRYSRVPLYLFLLLMVTISGFVGWTLWKSHTGNSQPAVSPPGEQPRAQRPEPGATSGDASISGDQAAATAIPADRGAPEPDDEAAHPPAPGGATQEERGATEEPEAMSQEPSATQQQPGSTTSPGGPASGAATPPAAGAMQPEGEGAVGQGAASTQGSPQSTLVPPSGPVYAVHVASYRRIENANQEIANLRKHGYEGRAVRTDLGSKGIWFRVLVGSYPNKEAAEEAREVILKLPEYAFAQVRRVTEP
jgi:hypothetical protein